MSQCAYQNKIVDYMYNELDDSEKNTLQQHIESCAVCQKTLQEFTVTSMKISSYQRPKPPRRLLAAYHSELRKIIPPKFSFFWRLREIWYQIVVQPPLPMRIAEFAIVLVIGMWIGRWQMVSKIEMPSSESTTLIDKNMLENYLANAEMLLLDVANLEMAPELAASNLPPMPFTFKATKGKVKQSGYTFVGEAGNNERADKRIFWGVKTTRIEDDKMKYDDRTCDGTCQHRSE